MRAAVALGLVLTLGCGESAAPPAPSTAAPTAPAAGAAGAAGAGGGGASAAAGGGAAGGGAAGGGAAAAATCASVGSTEAEVVPADAREANAAAVRLLATDPAAAEAALAAVLSAAPGYRMARYNHVCALSRVGRLEDAWRELLPLLCEELPTFAERLATDPDLAPLREADRSATLDAIAAEVRSAAEGGVPLVAFTHGPARGDERPGTEWEESQAGVYVHATGRFIPMGPRLRERGVAGPSGDGGFALTATRYDAARGRVLSVTARGTDAEDPALGAVEARVHEAPLARLIGEQRFSTLGPVVWAQLNESGATVWYFDEEEEHRAISFPVASSAASAPPEADALRVGPVAWFHVRARVRAQRPEVTLPDGRVLALGPPPRARDRSVQLTQDPDVVLVINEVHGECATPDAWSVERWVVSTGAHVEVASGQGFLIVEDLGDALFLQVGDQLTLHPDLGAGAAEVVRPGLGLTSMSRDFNPYC